LVFDFGALCVLICRQVEGCAYEFLSRYNELRGQDFTSLDMENLCEDDDVAYTIFRAIALSFMAEKIIMGLLLSVDYFIPDQPHELAEYFRFRRNLIKDLTADIREKKGQ
jgi:hypothetical protein